MKLRSVSAFALTVGAGLLLRTPVDAVTTKYDMTVVSTTTLANATNVVSVMDQGAGFVYAAYAVSGGGVSTISILKIRISDSQVMGTLTAPGISGSPTTALIDPAGGFAYFAATNSGLPAAIVQIDLSTFQIANTLIMNSSETDLASAAIDTADGFAYFLTPLKASNEVIKIQLSPFQRVSALPLPSGATSLVIDPANTYLYVGFSNFPSSLIVQIQLSSFLQTNSLTLPSDEYLSPALAIDPSTNFLYFGITDHNDGSVKIRRVDLNTLSLAPEYLAILTVNGTNSSLISMALDAANGFGYFTVADSPARLLEVNLASLSYANSLTEPGVYLRNLVGPFGSSLYVYAIDSLGNNDLLQVNLTPDSSLPQPLLLTINPTTVVLGSSNVTLMAQGTNFESGASIDVNGVPLSPTTFDGVNQLQATIPSADVASLGVDSVTVVNPNGQSSAIVWLTVVPAPPVITHLFPGAVAPGSSPVVLKIFGTGFQPGCVIQGTGFSTGSPGPSTPWFGTLMTTFVSAEELDALMQIPSGGPNNPPLNQPGNYSFWVQNPDKQTSNTRQFAVGPSLSTPQITGMTPEFAVAGNPGFTLKVTGTNFVAGSTVTWNAFDLPTTLANPNELDAFIPASDIATVGVDSIVVVAPEPPWEAGSAIAQFPVFATAPPIPLISSLQPGSTVAGSPAFTLQVLGSDFVSGATVTWNGSNLMTNYAGPGELDASIPASDVASVGVDSIVVINPYDQTSSTATFNVTALPAPILLSLQPGAAVAGSSAFTLQVKGSDFVSGATVTWNGSNLMTNFISGVELDASIPATDVAAVGVDSVVVINPDLQTSTTGFFTVTPAPLPPPILSTLTPGTTVAGSLAFTLQVKGSDFVSGATVTWNGSNLMTNFVSGGELDASIPQADVAAVGIDSVVVINPDLQTSTTGFFTVTSAPAVIPPPPPAPSLDGVPNLLPVNSQIQISYPPGYSIRSFIWSMQPENSSSAGGSDASDSFAQAGGITFPTPAPQANLAPYNLSPGLYILGLQVEDTYGQFSPQAQKTVALVSADLSGVRVYPNPWQINLHQGYPITFDHMPPGSTVKIFTISGHWVATLSATNGQAVWADLKNADGNSVATGIYYYLVTDGQGNKTHGKFGVIR